MFKIKTLYNLSIYFFAFYFPTYGFADSATRKKMPTKESNQLVVNKILTLTIDSSINPATYNYLVSGYEKAKSEDFDLVLIKLNTPGGLVSTTKNILTLIGSNKKATAVWITPEGASATSAGAIIAAGSHLLFMANGTNIGAATPINMSAKDLNKDLRSKAVNDLVALVTSLAQTRGRNQEMFANMIRDASSYTSNEAKEEKLIDGIVNDHKQLGEQLNNKSIVLQGVQKTITVQSPKFVNFDMDAGQKLLNILADPNMAYVLFILGAALLYLEFQTMGGFIAGAIGIICLLLAGIGFQILPLNFGAFSLIILAFILFVIEIFVTSYGILSLAGFASLITGSLFLFRTDDAYIQISKALIFTTSGIVGFFIMLVGLFIVRDIRKNKASKNYYSLGGKQATVVSTTEEPSSHNDFYYYQIRVAGEIWKARSKNQYEKGDRCKIKEGPTNNDLTLSI